MKVTCKKIFLLIICLFFPLSGKVIQNFTLENIDGSTFRLEDIIGKKIILLDFWATWCKPCKKQLKEFNKIYLKYPDHLLVAAISMDKPTAISEVKSYIKGRRYKITVLLDPDSQVSRIYNPSLKIPFSLIINKRGEIVKTHRGYLPGSEIEMEKIIKELISE